MVISVCASTLKKYCTATRFPEMVPGRSPPNSTHLQPSQSKSPPLSGKRVFSHERKNENQPTYEIHSKSRNLTQNSAETASQQNPSVLVSPFACFALNRHSPRTSMRPSILIKAREVGSFAYRHLLTQWTALTVSSLIKVHRQSPTLPSSSPVESICDGAPDCRP